MIGDKKDFEKVQEMKAESVNKIFKDWEHLNFNSLMT